MMFALWSSLNNIPIEYKSVIKKTSHLRSIYLKRHNAKKLQCGLQPINTTEGSEIHIMDIFTISSRIEALTWTLANKCWKGCWGTQFYNLHAWMSPHTFWSQSSIRIPSSLFDLSSTQMLKSILVAKHG